MKEEIFQDCLEKWNVSDGHTGFWKELAEKWDYPSSESLRQEFKYIRRKRGIKKDDSVVSSAPTHGAKILLFDIESTPILAFTWGLWDQNISTEAIVQDWHLLSWGAKWIFSDEIMSMVLTPEEARKHDDKRILVGMWNLLNEADIVVGHNCDQFDTKKLNTRFLINGMLPTKSFQSIDTLKVARSQFSFSSAKLDYINEVLGLPQKEDTDLQLWIDCYNGDQDALKKMESYNRNDVDILEDMYLRVRPYIKGHPNLNLWNEENVSVCPNCGGTNIVWGGRYYTYTGYYQAFTCSHCGAHGRDRKMETPKEKRKTIVR